MVKGKKEKGRRVYGAVEGEEWRIEVMNFSGQGKSWRFSVQMRDSEYKSKLSREYGVE